MSRKSRQCRTVRYVWLVRRHQLLLLRKDMSSVGVTSNKVPSTVWPPKVLVSRRCKGVVGDEDHVAFLLGFPEVARLHDLPSHHTSHATVSQVPYSQRSSPKHYSNSQDGLSEHSRRVAEAVITAAPSTAGHGAYSAQAHPNHPALNIR